MCCAQRELCLRWREGWSLTLPAHTHTNMRTRFSVEVTGLSHCGSFPGIFYLKSACQKNNWVKCLKRIKSTWSLRAIVWPISFWNRKLEWLCCNAWVIYTTTNSARGTLYHGWIYTKLMLVYWTCLNKRNCKEFSKRLLSSHRRLPPHLTTSTKTISWMTGCCASMTTFTCTLNTV